MKVEPEEIRRVRALLGEHQAKFGARFDVCRRTVIRWEQRGAEFQSWQRWSSANATKSEKEIWEATVQTAEAMAAKAKKNSTRKSATALAARKPKSARRRNSAHRAVAVKRRRGRVARRRSVAKAKKRAKR